jgi:hypothetical protein
MHVSTTPPILHIRYSEHADVERVIGLRFLYIYKLDRSIVD